VAIDGHVKGIAAHLKSMMNPEADDDVLDDPEDGDGDDGDDDKAFLIELQKIAEQAQELT
jgi:hypothetical protein